MFPYHRGKHSPNDNVIACGDLLLFGKQSAAQKTMIERHHCGTMQIRKRCIC